MTIKQYLKQPIAYYQYRQRYARYAQTSAAQGLKPIARFSFWQHLQACRQYWHYYELHKWALEHCPYTELEWHIIGTKLSELALILML